MNKITVETREIAPRWSDCSGTSGYIEYRVRVNGRVFIDWYPFDDKDSAIETAQWCLRNEQ